MSQREDYQRICTLVEKAVGGGADPEDVAWTVMEGVTTLIDGLTGTTVAGLAAGSLKTLRDGISSSGGIDTVPNPWFVWNGHADEDSDISYTKKYLKRRAYKSVGGGILGLAGVASSQVTQVDVAGIGMHSNAVVSSSMHLMKLKSIGSGHKGSDTITGWVDLLVRMKALKIGVRGAQLAGAAIPVGAVGIAAGLAAAAVKLGVTLTHTKACAITSANIHWRAYQEQAISVGRFGSGGKIGPASNMMYEIFCRRGATRIFGKYDVDRIIKEPTGWMCLNDKLLLI